MAMRVGHVNASWEEVVRSWVPLSRCTSDWERRWQREGEGETEKEKDRDREWDGDGIRVLWCCSDLVLYC